MIRNGREASNVPIFRTRERCVEEETLLRVLKEKNARANETYLSLSLSLSLFFFLGREDVKVFKACACECESARVFLQIFLNARTMSFSVSSFCFERGTDSDGATLVL